MRYRPEESPQEEADLTGVQSIPVSYDASAAELAVNAAQTISYAARQSPKRIDYLVHSWLHYQGADLWSPPHFIAREIGALNCLPLGIHQGCDGGAMALRIAGLQLQRERHYSTAVVTASDRFAEPAVDRWNCQRALVLGDVGTAALLTNDPFGPVRFQLNAIATYSDPSLEPINRGSDEFQAFPYENGMPADQRTYIANSFGAESMGRIQRIAREAIARVLRAAAVDAWLPSVGSLRAICLPRVGNPTIETIYDPVLDEQCPGVQRLQYKQRTGHLGCSDWLADLDALAGEDLRPGDRIGLLCAGGGFTWACAVLTVM